MIKTILKVIAVTGAVVLGVGACSVQGNGAGTPQEVPTQKIRVAYTSPSWTAEMSYMAVAEELGFYDEEGIEPIITLAPGGSETIQQVIGGQADIGVGTPEPVVISREQGSDIRYFMPYFGHFIFSLAALPGSDISSVEDLKGKRIGVSATASNGAIFARTALERSGLSENDVSFVPIGVGAKMISALERNEVDALAMWDSQYELQRLAGFDPQPIVVDGLEDLFGGGYYAPVEKLQSDPDKFTKWARATAKGLTFSKANPEEALRILWDKYPEVIPGDAADKDQVFQEQLAIMKSRLGYLMDGSTDNDWIELSTQQADAYTEWALEAGLITKQIPGKDIIFTGLSSDIADFDAAEVAGRSSN